MKSELIHVIAVVDGLKGFPDAINAAFPDTTVQTCIVHLVRHSLNFCGWKDRKEVAKSLKRIYQATDDGEAEKALDDFEAERGRKYPSIAPSWRRSWQEAIPFFAFPPSVRKIIYTTNAIEPEPGDQENHENTRQLSNRRRGDQADLSRHPKIREHRTVRQRMGCCP